MTSEEVKKNTKEEKKETTRRRRRTLMKKGKIMHKDFGPGSNSLGTVDRSQIHDPTAYLKPVLHWANLSAINEYSLLKTLCNQCYKIVPIFGSDFFPATNHVT